MKKNNILIFFGVAVMATFLVGCDKSQRSNNKPVYPPVISKDLQKIGAENPDAPTTKELLKYYSDNLNEAKIMWDKCGR